MMSFYPRVEFIQPSSLSLPHTQESVVVLLIKLSHYPESSHTSMDECFIERLGLCEIVDPRVGTIRHLGCE